MKDHLKCLMAISATLLFAGAAFAQQNCCKVVFPAPAGQFCPQTCCPQTCCPQMCIRQTCCTPACCSKSYCHQSWCAPTCSTRTFSASATNFVARPGCALAWQPTTFNGTLWQRNMPSCQTCPQPVAQRILPYQPPINRACQGRLTPAEAEAMRQTFTNNPNMTFQQRLRNCYSYCDLNFPDYPCNEECHAACPDDFLETCDCDCWPTRWGEICFCVTTFLNDPPEQ